jgi:hypothetical protein
MKGRENCVKGWTGWTRRGAGSDLPPKDRDHLTNCSFASSPSRSPNRASNASRMCRWRSVAKQNTPTDRWYRASLVKREV